MDKIHTLNEIIERLCRHTGCTEREAADFISAVTEEITTRLKAREEDIELPQVGRFGVDRQGYVVFSPAREIAAQINEPFSLFESVMLEPGVTAEELAGISDTDEPAGNKDVPAPSQAPTPTPLAPEEPEPVPAAEEPVKEVHEEVATPAPALPTPPPAVEPKPAEQPVAPQPAVHPEEPNRVDAASPEALPEDDSYYDSYPDYEDGVTVEQHRFNPILAYILGIVTGFLVCCVLVYFLYPKLMNDSIDSAYGVTNDQDDEEEDTLLTEEDPTPSFAVAEVAGETAPTTATPAQAASSQPASEPVQSAQPAAKASPEVVYDTVRPGYFLTKIAQKHYGVQEFWVYIYEENKDRIANPMKLPAGFKVVVPPAEKYGIDPGNPASVEKAKNISHELNKKFK